MTDLNTGMSARCEERTLATHRRVRHDQEGTTGNPGSGWRERPARAVGRQSTRDWRNGFATLRD
jgi:hypothetical protein